MTNEEAKTFLDNLKVCVEEHPIVADWLVEIADRKTEPTSSKMEQVDKDINVRSKWETPPKFEHKGDITTCVSVPACLLEIEDEPQTEKPKIRKRNDKPFRAVWLDDDHNEIGTTQTDCSWR